MIPHLRQVIVGRIDLRREHGLGHGIDINGWSESRICLGSPRTSAATPLPIGVARVTGADT
jgi:hypothetical protein